MEGSKSARTIAPEPAQLVVRARALIPVLAKRSLEQKQRRGILPETIAEMQTAGFFRVLQPRRWGGYEMDLGTFYDIEMALGEGDMSSGWTYGVLGVVSWFLGVMDDRAAQEVWGHDTTTLICSHADGVHRL
jgi:3-hydroxy-9,10-secoandrosta-1,3,5(10)-triene-9,17-dione monooxygenase